MEDTSDRELAEQEYQKADLDMNGTASVNDIQVALQDAFIKGRQSMRYELEKVKENQMKDKPFLTEEIEKVFGGLRDAIEDEDLAEWYLSVVNTFTENQLSVVKAEISRLHEKIKLLEDQLQWAKEKGKSEF